MTTFAPIAPTILVPPTRIAKDTFVIHHVQPALGQPLFVYFNSMVILGKEPVVVDTGCPANREQWLKDVFSLVEPNDVRWIFLSHDDVDHTGNLDETLSACPNAQLVCNWAMVERHTNCFDFPLKRCRWVMHGESLDVGDRTLHALRPPVYDSPTTRGLFDPTTGVYWSVDTFATPLPDPGATIADLDSDFWDYGLQLFALGAVSPWLTMLDIDKFSSYVDITQNLGITTIAPCHSPVLEGPFIERAFARIRQLRPSTLRRCPTNRCSTRSSPLSPNHRPEVLVSAEARLSKSATGGRAKVGGSAYRLRPEVVVSSRAVAGCLAPTAT